jgi:hypothetical protein
MKSKSLAIVLGVAALSVAGAFLAISRMSTDSTLERGGAFVPEVAEKSAEIARIELERGGKSIRLAKDGDTWKVASSDSYPARFEEVKGLVAGIAALRADDKMTAKKERHAELGLAWPDETGRGARVRLYGAGEAPLADLVLGEERANPRSQFVRRGAEDQCWRVLGSVLVDIEPRRWVEAEILSIPEGEVRSVVLDGLEIRAVEGTGGAVGDTANRTQYEALAPAALAPAGSTEWTEARRTIAARTMPSWLARLELDDVRRAKGGAADPAISPSFDMVRGTLKVNAVREGDAVWISFEARAKDGAPSAADINAKKKYPGDPFVPDWSEFAAKHAGWEYRLPAWKLSSLEEARKSPAEGESGEGADMPVQLPGAGG